MTSNEALTMLINAEAHLIAHYGYKEMRKDSHEGKLATQSIAFAMGAVTQAAIRERVAEYTKKTTEEVLSEAIEACRVVVEAPVKSDTEKSIEGAEKEVEKLKAEGWTKQDFASALKSELESNDAKSNTDDVV